ncbi:hypothetical protein CPB86DRAFT_791664 [Serendipita vermifera]|nr:hypothetical protein CPB86DRAFT_791664 [Serendipita vermifera]
MVFGGRLGDCYCWGSRENVDLSLAMHDEWHPMWSTHPLWPIWRATSPLSVETNEEHFKLNLNRRYQMISRTYENGKRLNRFGVRSFVSYGAHLW